MGFRFTLGRIAIGLLIIMQGIVLMQGGYKDQVAQFKDLRSYLNKETDHLPLLQRMVKATNPYMTDPIISFIVYA
jgi:hypothetical protein